MSTVMNKEPRGLSRSAVPAVVAFVAIVFSVVYYLEWRSSRTQAQELVASMAQTGEANAKAIAEASSRWRTLTDRLERLLDELRSAAQETRGASSTPAEGPEKVEPRAEEPSAHEPRVDDLPVLPEGTRAVALVRTAGLEDLLRDSRLNPGQKELDRVSRMKAEAAWVTAKATADIMDSQNRIAMVVGMEEMRKQGSFVEYARGERAEHDSNAITAGEPGENGKQRIYYFYPDDYPELFQRERAIQDACEVAVRQVLSLLQ